MAQDRDRRAPRVATLDSKKVVMIGNSVHDRTGIEQILTEMGRTVLQATELQAKARARDPELAESVLDRIAERADRRVADMTARKAELEALLPQLVQE